MQELYASTYDDKKDQEKSDGDTIIDWDFPLIVCMAWIIFSIEYDSVIVRWVIGILSALLYIITRRKREIIQFNYIPLNNTGLPRTTI